MRNLATVLGKFERQLHLSKNCLVSHNFVIKVGAYTMTLNEDKRVDYKNSLEFPSQWNDEGVKAIKKALLEMGDDREPIVMFYKDFYKETIVSIKEAMKFEAFMEANQEILSK